MKNAAEKMKNKILSTDFLKPNPTIISNVTAKEEIDNLLPVFKKKGFKKGVILLNELGVVIKEIKKYQDVGIFRRKSPKMFNHFLEAMYKCHISVTEKNIITTNILVKVCYFQKKYKEATYWSNNDSSSAPYVSDDR